MEGKIVFSTQKELNILYLDKRDSWKSPVELSLPSRGDMAHYPVWLPDGKTVLFKYTTFSSNTEKEYLATIALDRPKVTPFKLQIGDITEKDMRFPKWSPNGIFLAALIFTEGGESPMRDNYTVMIYNTATKDSILFNRIYAGRSPLGWSTDSKNIVYETPNGEIAIYNLDNSSAWILDKGKSPVFHPMNKHIYYISEDSYLYSIKVDRSERQQVDDSDWSWFQLFDFSKNGQYLFFIGGGSFLMSEYSSINVFDLNSHKKKRLSKKYGIIHGASLFRD